MRMYPAKKQKLSLSFETSYNTNSGLITGGVAAGALSGIQAFGGNVSIANTGTGSIVGNINGYAIQGAGGGIELMDGYQTRLTGFTADEAAVVPLAGQPELAALLGLGVVARSARRKLGQALAPALAATTPVDGWFLHDPVGRAGPAVPVDRLQVIARATRLQVEVELGGADLVVRPLGLVLEEGVWLLVHLTADGPQVRALRELTGRAVLGRRFTRPADFDLSGYWRSLPPPTP